MQVDRYTRYEYRLCYAKYQCICIYMYCIIYIYIYIHVELAELQARSVYIEEIYRLIVSEEKVVCGVFLIGKSLKACLVALQSINQSIN